ncbi:DNA translocase FtsK [Sulfurimonas sp.]|jgi:DNA segregation ATPase FtsK/SpoIIIE-like protein|uniref:DNA translocase FtsK n=1 Tax=Sulfurimonas sp. TaxID=2022749 RepID=UPI0025ED2C6B|nr:DNA translocase FtsK [Sulfurimonas sp.]MBT5935653.1 hypothetical protein [Sulfurimonas sp.]
MGKNKRLFKEAKAIVLSNNNFNIAFLQRNMQIGYNRAWDLMDVIKRSLINKETRYYKRLVSKNKKKLSHAK